MSTVPQHELDIFIASAKSRPDYLDTTSVIGAYASYGLHVIPDPFSADIAALIQDALTGEKPLSVIRIGDGEANLLTCGAYPGTHTLDQYAAAATIGKHQDTFAVNENWVIDLRNLMLEAIVRADIVGVLGLWRTERLTVTKLISRFLKDHRGMSGHWRGIEYMLRLAGANRLNGKIIASAHLYFSIVKHLGTILPRAKKIFIISDRTRVFEKMSRTFNSLQFEYIEVGNTRTHCHPLPDQPVFLQNIYAALPHDMRGCLCLIGAGPWAEIYCTWVKERGGVGVDIGSGFDLLDGAATRPVHKRIGRKQLKNYRL